MENVRINFPVQAWVVEVDQNHDYGGLHSVTSSHLLVSRVRPGDKIVATISGERTVEIQKDGSFLQISARIDAPKVDRNTWWRTGKLVRHPGRSATLGEDTLDDAFGDDAAPELFSELLRDVVGWEYAPVELVVCPDREGSPRYYDFLPTLVEGFCVWDHTKTALWGDSLPD